MHDVSWLKRLIAVSLLLVLLVACEQERIVEVTRLVTQEVTRVTVETEILEVTRLVTRQIEPTPVVERVVTLDLAGPPLSTLDPQFALERPSTDYIENLFVQLANHDPQSGMLEPEAATEWEIGEEGQRYTFHLRSDIPWVKYNPISEETIQVTDAEGQPRFVTAADFVTAFRRGCLPGAPTPYGELLAEYVSGCGAVRDYDEPGDVPQELLEAIGVAAPEPTRLVVDLEAASGAFLSLVPLWTLSAVPDWTIEQYGPRWTEPGIIVSNGRFVLAEWVHNGRRTLRRNPLFPADLAGAGNVERVVDTVAADAGDSYVLWLSDEVDLSPIPPADLAAHREALPEETVIIPRLRVTSIVFRSTRPPFDEAAVRRAFAAAIDRNAFVQQELGGRGRPIHHLAPPSVFGAPPSDEIGLSYDPDYAREQLADAGYPDCDEFPAVSFLLPENSQMVALADYARAQWEAVLGCDPALIDLEFGAPDELTALTGRGVPEEDAPDLWMLAWEGTLPDENEWVGTVLWCDGGVLARECTPLDELIVEARTLLEPSARAEQYRLVEEEAFAEDGEMPLVPIWEDVEFAAVHTWVRDRPIPFGGARWYDLQLDWAAKRAVQQQ